MKKTTLKLIALSAILSISAEAKYSSTYTVIPKNAPPILPILYDEVNEVIPGFNAPAYFPALIEQESCITLYRKRCFSPKSKLYARRKNGEHEEGAGFFQLTRVNRRNGSTRIDTLSYLVRKYPKQLRGLTWKNVYDKPGLQIRAALLLWKDNYDRIKRVFGKGMSEFDLIAFADSAYNGGYGGLRKDVQSCARLSKHGKCNPKKWFGNVERTCTKSKRILYGHKNACDINREHVYNVLLKRFGKYYVDFIRGQYEMEDSNEGSRLKNTNK